MFDLFFENAHIADGTGKAIYKSNVGVSDGKIAYIGSEKPCSARQFIELNEHEVLCPGFIDSHSHSDLYLYHDKFMKPRLLQGITTDISGNCGHGMAPVNPMYFEDLKNDIGVAFSGIRAPEEWISYRTFKDFLDGISRLKPEINTGFYAAHGALRIAVMGFDGSEPDESQMETMKSLLRESMEAGALGMSTGLIYVPGSYARTRELTELCKVVKEYGGVYATHMRDEGCRIIESVKETIDLARNTGVTVLISHHKVAGIKNRHLIADVRKLIDDANHEGLKVYIDQYPYGAGATFLTTTIPYRYFVGGVSALLGRLKDQVLRAEIRREMLNNDGTWQNPLDNEGFDGIYVALAKNDNSFNGMNISQIAQKLDMDPVDVIFKLLIDNDGFVGCIFQFMTDSDVEDIFKNPRVSVATDAVLFGDGIPTHPRGYATYPKILGNYVREKNLVSLEEAIKKMTSMPADIFGFSKKGRISVGNDADLVVFNRDTIIDHGDFLNPKAENEGYTLVAVGGKVVYHGGKLFECCAGKIMKRQDI